MSASLGLCWRQHCQFLSSAFFLKPHFWEGINKNKENCYQCWIISFLKMSVLKISVQKNMISPTNLNILRRYVIVVTFISSNRCNGLSMPYPSLFGTGCWWYLCEGFLIDLWGEFSHDPSSASFTWQSPLSLEWHILALEMKLHTDEESECP
jgi:hypothetical protein